MGKYRNTITYKDSSKLEIIIISHDQPILRDGWLIIKDTSGLCTTRINLDCIFEIETDKIMEGQEWGA